MKDLFAISRFECIIKNLLEVGVNVVSVWYVLLTLDNILKTDFLFSKSYYKDIFCAFEKK